MTRAIPGRFRTFLEKIKERAILRKAGGGYLFIHPTVMEYFASLEGGRPGGCIRGWRLAGSAVVVCMILASAAYSVRAASQIRVEGAKYFFEQGNEAGETDLEKAYQYSLRAARWVDENPQYLNNACWFGSLSGHADQVLDLCNKAVALALTDSSIRDSRGLARALTGDYSGAIEDFEYFIQYSEKSGSSVTREESEKRKNWVEKMRSGEEINPEEIIRDLR
jgi:hypothetical protein